MVFYKSMFVILLLLFEQMQVGVPHSHPWGEVQKYDSIIVDVREGEFFKLAELHFDWIAREDLPYASLFTAEAEYFYDTELSRPIISTDPNILGPQDILERKVPLMKLDIIDRKRHCYYNADEIEEELEHRTYRPRMVNVFDFPEELKEAFLKSPTLYVYSKYNGRKRLPQLTCITPDSRSKVGGDMQDTLRYQTGTFQTFPPEIASVIENLKDEYRSRRASITLREPYDDEKRGVVVGEVAVRYLINDITSTKKSVIKGPRLSHEQYWVPAQSTIVLIVLISTAAYLFMKYRNFIWAFIWLDPYPGKIKESKDAKQVSLENERNLLRARARAIDNDRRSRKK